MNPTPGTHPKEVMLVHDNRTVGFINAVVLHRLLSRKGVKVSSFSGPASMRPVKTLEFWTSIVDQIPLKRGRQPILCCIAFDDRNSEKCLMKLARLGSKSGVRPAILTHRWPDGYIDSDCEIIVPPFEVVEKYAAQLDRGERELLRLSLIISRQADPEYISKDEADLADALQSEIYFKPKKCWDELSNAKKDPVALIERLRRHGTGGGAPIPDLKLEDKAYKLFELNSKALGFMSHAPKTITQWMSDAGDADKIGIGVLNKEGDSHIYMVRHWGSRLPSIDWLIEKYHKRFGLPEPRHWYGPRNAMSLLLKRAGLTPANLPELENKLIKFADETFNNRHGERTCEAGLAHMVFEAASQALVSLDLLRRFTASKAPSIHFDPRKIRIIVEPSTRTGELKETLVLRLQIESSEAAAFIFGFSGYNLLKLERLLEGALIGVGSERSRWLGALKVPKKLRVDTNLSANALRGMPRALEHLSEISLVPLTKARSLGIVADGSSMMKAFKKASPAGNIVCFRGSETIGPSVPYAITIGAIVGALSVQKGKKALSVLDLFSGSGLSALLASKSAAQVFCVDSATTARQVQIGDDENIIWLHGDFRSTLSGENGLLDRRFDLVCMDPPHSILVELLFKKATGGKTCIQFVREHVAEWIVIYQGHSSQIGRGKALQRVLTQTFARSELWQVGGEVMTIAGPEKWSGSSFDRILENAKTSLKQECAECGWELSVE